MRASIPLRYACAGPARLRRIRTTPLRNRTFSWDAKTPCANDRPFDGRGEKIEEKSGSSLPASGQKRETSQGAESGSRKPIARSRTYRPPYPADCIDCREISAVEAM